MPKAVMASNKSDPSLLFMVLFLSPLLFWLVGWPQPFQRSNAPFICKNGQLCSGCSGLTFGGGNEL